MAIFVLDAHTAELIAAGEVVERPASVVKELCENAIDAKATQITVEIERGGVGLIRIVDNGIGIAKEDIPTAFLRHATSKVRTQDDLDAICTLGFRGEALPSIASVAKVKLTSRSENANDAYCYDICGGQGGQPEFAAHPVGTTIEVRQLFYNTPARMKFLKKDASEGGFVGEVVGSLALSHPEIAFKFTREGKNVFASPGDGKLKSAAYAVLGPAFTKDLIELWGSEGGIEVTGLVTPPGACRASRSMQYFYLNGRLVKNSTIMAALEGAFRGFVMQGRFAGAILFVNMPPQLVDVNVHPAKTQVRFAHEADVFNVVYRAVKTAISGGAPQTIKPVAAERTENAHTIVVDNSHPNKAVFEGELQSAAGAVAYAVKSGARPYMQAQAQQNTTLRRLDIEYAEPIKENPIQVCFEAKTEVPQMVVLGEIFKTYIIAECEDSLCLIDKHAAHERIIYEKLESGRSEPDMQLLLAPVNVTLGAAEKAAVLENEQTLGKAGVQVEDFGGNTVLVRSVPADMDVGGVEDFVTELACGLVKDASDTQTKKTQWIMHSIACRAALKAGDKTPKEQLLKLAEDILSGLVPPYCPHGRPVVQKLTRKELDKKFGRV